jgi:peptidoglycan/LPS O-acetylase OafA/YrhL
MPTVATTPSLTQYTDNENPGGFSHVPALDGIRGLAILLVLIDHLLWANSHTGSRLLDLLGDIRSSTFIGVNLFFVLSGFLITGILVNTVTIPHFFKTFYGRRALRIFPLYYTFLFILIALTKPLHFQWWGEQYYSLLYIGNIVVWHRSYLNLGHFNINHFWSLQVEEQFYFIWPLVIYRVRRLQTVVRICLIGCAVILGIRTFITIMLGLHIFTNIYLTGSPTFSCADNLLFGCCLAVLMRTHWHKKVLHLAPRVLGIAAAILLALAIPNHGLGCFPGASPIASALIQTLGFSFLGISAAALIAMALRSGSRTQRLFQNRLLRFLGKYSYGIYVFHYSIEGFLEAPIRNFLNVHLHSKGLSVVIGALIIGGLSVLVAMLSYHLFEVHFLRLKRYFSYNRATPQQPVSQPL